MNETIVSRIELKANELSILSDEISILKERLNAKEEIFNRIKTKDLPNLMEEEGMLIGSIINLKNGKTIKLEEFFRASIPSNTAINREKDPYKRDELIERRENCFKKLDELGAGDIIKNTIVSDFGREENQKALETLQLLRDNGIACKKIEDVHSSTLKATLKELLGKGEDIEPSLFNIYSGAIVKIKG